MKFPKQIYHFKSTKNLRAYPFRVISTQRPIYLPISITLFHPHFSADCGRSTQKRGIPVGTPLSRFISYNTLSGRNYLIWKTTGKVNLTFTGSPFCLPGSHCGDIDTTLTASSSRILLPELLATVTSFTFPSLAIVN